VPIVTPAPTSRSMSAIPSSWASRRSRRSRIQMHGTRLLKRRPIAFRDRHAATILESQILGVAIGHEHPYDRCALRYR
jgi:hypothetical protein